MSIMPGRAYPEGDVPLFEELRRIIERSGIGGLEAQQLVATLQESWLTSGEQEALKAFAFWVPNFEPLRTILAAKPGRSDQALAMLDVILRARARERRSGFLRQQGSTGEETNPPADDASAPLRRPG